MKTIKEAKHYLESIGYELICSTLAGSQSGFLYIKFDEHTKTKQEFILNSNSLSSHLLNGG